jgi:DNA-binding MarR family transcriptional regulator
MDQENKYDSLKLKNHFCFPLYAAARETIKRYRPYLDELDLTYTQYIAMTLLWEHGTLTVKEIGDQLFLDSGTLTPLLKKLEAKGFVTRTRSTQAERNLNVTVTEKGLVLREKALEMSINMWKYNNLTTEELADVYSLLYKLLRRNCEEPDWLSENKN